MIISAEGYSDRPPTIYDTGLYTRQLYELLKGLDLKRPVDLIGNYQVGKISIAFTYEHPDMVRRLILVDPGGIGTNNFNTGFDEN